MKSQVGIHISLDDKYPCLIYASLPWRYNFYKILPNHKRFHCFHTDYLETAIVYGGANTIASSQCSQNNSWDYSKVESFKGEGRWNDTMFGWDEFSVFFRNTETAIGYERVQENGSERTIHVEAWFPHQASNHKNNTISRNFNQAIIQILYDSDGSQKSANCVKD